MNAFEMAQAQFDKVAKLTNLDSGVSSVLRWPLREFRFQIEAEDAWLSQEVDILIPSALEAQINADNVGLVNPLVKLIAEGANGPTTPDADEALIGQGVFVISDFLCNAGA